MESTYSRHQEYEHPDTEIRIRRRRRKPRVRSRSRYATTEDSDSQRSDLNHSGNEKQEIDRADDEDGAEEPDQLGATRRSYRPITTIDWRGEICQFLNLPFESTNKAILSALGEASEKLQEVDRLKSLELAKQGPPRYQILHSVHCLSPRSRTLYLSEPWVEEYGPHNAHLMGKSPIYNLELYLERNKDVKFLVFREYKCCGRPPPAVDNNSKDDDLGLQASALMSGERITHLCADLRLALSMIADKALQGADHPEFDNQEFGNEVIPYPYLWWYHRRGAIELAKAKLDTGLRKYIDLLKDYFKTRLQKEWEAVRKLTARKKIMKKYLQYIFMPGEIIISHKKGKTSTDVNAYCASFTLDELPESPQTHLATISAASWAFDGTFERRHVELFISRLTSTSDDGEFDITDLSVYPMEFASRETIEALRRRGRMFWKCRHRNYVQYTGAIDDGMQVSAESRFMIDMVTYKQMHPEARRSEENSSRMLEPLIMFQDDPDLGDDFFMCLPSTIRGFNMRTKHWEMLEVDRIRDVVWNTEAFNSLVIEPTAKTLVQAVVTNQIHSQDGTDLIQGKGNGLFILLHGGPGTGKTLTAESVAEIAKKPLYRVTCGDIGTKAEAVEKYLDIVLLLGKTWDCVVLLDEADVFLEQRSLLNLERNALVSVFLRALEYYDGILILTSNRVGIFDEAFKSRVQLNLRYKNLNREQRRKIWENFITRLEHLVQERKDLPLEEQLPGFDVNATDIKQHLDELAEAHLNGREIRNAISTARQLAMFYREPMQFKHLKSVIGEAQKFDDYLLELRDGITADEMQRDKQER